MAWQHESLESLSALVTHLLVGDRPSLLFWQEHNGWCHLATYLSVVLAVVALVRLLDKCGDDA